MRANRDEGRPEPHTLIKFANPYFKDSSSVVSYMHSYKYFYIAIYCKHMNKCPWCLMDTLQL